jgi:hypothetical protein
MATYQDRFANASIESKRADLACNPFFDKEKILVALDEDIVILHEAVMETLGEDIFEDDDWY